MASAKPVKSRNLRPPCSRRFSRRLREKVPPRLCALRNALKLVRQQVFLTMEGFAAQLLRGYEGTMKALIQLEIEQRLIEGASGYASRGTSSTTQRWRKIQIVSSSRTLSFIR